MVGQKRLLEYIDTILPNYPRFSIICGIDGSGKKTLAKYIAQKMNMPIVYWGNKIDDIRELNSVMLEQVQNTMYCISNYESMSNNARNSLLKICEEPPNNAFIVLTSTIKDIVLPTLLNRGIVLEMQSYSEDELHCIEKDNYGFDMGHSREHVDKMVKICRVPGDLNKVRNLDIDEFEQFVNRFWQNIAKASAGNALKIANRIKLKEDDADTTKYDLDIFLNYVMYLNSCEKKSLEQMKIFKQLLTAKRFIYLKYNKQYILDDLILYIRGVKSGII